MPDAVLRGLWDIQQGDPAAYNDYLAKMGGTLAMLKLSWKVNETRDLLEEGKIGNTQLSDAEMEIMEARLNRLVRERDRFIGEKKRSSWSDMPCPSCGDPDRPTAAPAGVDGGGGHRLVPTRVRQGSRFGAQSVMGYGY